MLGELEVGIDNFFQFLDFCLSGDQVDSLNSKSVLKIYLFFENLYLSLDV